MFLLDTCALLWWTIDPEKLSDRAAGACSMIYEHGAFISSVSTRGNRNKNKEKQTGYRNRYQRICPPSQAPESH